ncbi:50S ribosomal protein L24 [Myxococcota bacterium]|nr:50S ribosomal protein L24 [Myxococcota bacterium]MBU1382621.1 50S ribosomal protein L24 [Myxococcota bacterium]MBU1495838.1 50S ribosomal protein L24 [Myxococcota bacterium]
MLARIKKGDLVKVITGKYKGKTGKVLRVLTKKEQVIVEGVNIVVKNKKATGENQKGTQTKTEAPIHISNVQPVDPATAAAAGGKDEKTLVRGTRIGTKVLPDGRKVRIARGKKSSGDIIESGKA